jgi:hypothetical protein
MSKGTSSSTGLGVLIAGIVAAVLIVAGVSAIKPPDRRMPPDPFVSNEPQEVQVEVVWSGIVRVQQVFWKVGDETDELSTEGTHSGNIRFWNHTDIAFSGDTVIVRSVQTIPGPLQCVIYLDEEEVAADETESVQGCEAQYRVP